MSSNFLKNITSKDILLSQNTIKDLIKTADTKLFQELCDKSDFIFPFLKERIIKDFVKFISKEDLKTIFEFAKIYNEDFSSLIVSSLTKFASEDLTDDILELFETGSEEQKAYCALYFSKIKDTLALDFLNKNALSDFEPLKVNCAKTLAEFKDTTLLEDLMEKVLLSEDDFEKLSAFEFICAYKSVNSLNFVIKNCFSCGFYENIILNLLNTYDFDFLKNNIKENEIFKIFQVLLESYPEENSLNTISFYQVFDYLNYLAKSNSNYAKNILLKAKNDFSCYLNNDIYNYDLDKNEKTELSKIVQFLNNLKINPDFKDELINFNNNNFRFSLTLNLIKETKNQDCFETLANLINENKLAQKQLIGSLETLKEFNKIDLVSKQIVDNIQDENIKAVVLSLLN